MTIMLWSSAVIPSSDRPIFVKEAEFDNLRKALEEQDCWPKVFRVLPNGEGPLPLIAFLIKMSSESPAWCLYDHERLIAQRRLTPRSDRLQALGPRVAHRDSLLALSLNEVRADYRALLRSGIDALLAVQSMDGHGLILASRALAAESRAQLRMSGSSVHPLTPLLADWLIELAEQVVLPISQGVTSEQSAPSPASRNWWASNSTLIARCQTLRANLQLVVAGFVAMPVITKLDSWLSELLSALQGLTVVTGAQKQEQAKVFFVASAWFFACALRSMETGFASRALLYLHRSAEWLLMGKAVELDLIAFDIHGGRYKNPTEYGVHDTEKPGFSIHMRILLQFTSLRFCELEGLLFELNDWRNLHPLAHHMSTATMPVAEKLFYKIVNHLPRFASAEAWTTSLSSFAVTPTLDLSDLLDPDGMLRGAVIS
ncbi:hypothetical protein [Xanthomonas nasturtii]|uniref:hypothetical protein n=1 Tax=Xanthomonas nasturtii TaxID=1843581 RepID=UPI002012634F|nr:hypothetical protein [Xanthomonas nasturtii]MCL1501518.1 hypothetical protein [Xanthomonas nasturtii]MCL1505433.1 hypothetical protein [Xanthomonas nasturtii]MCL1524947.1 hypothetical protein [Xanthomonas nasturtii]